MRDILSRIDNDTLIIVGMIVIALLYGWRSPDAQVVNTIVAGFVGYLGGQYVATRKE